MSAVKLFKFFSHHLVTFSNVFFEFLSCKIFFDKKICCFSPFKIERFDKENHAFHHLKLKGLTQVMMWHF